MKFREKQRADNMEKSPLMKRIISDPWYKSRPSSVKAAVRTWPPGRYLLKTTGQQVEIYSYTEDEDGKCRTCKVIVKKGHNLGFLVFGIPFGELKLISEAKIK